MSRWKEAAKSGCCNDATDRERMSILCSPSDSNELRLLHQFVPVPCFVSTLELRAHLFKINRERDFQRGRLTAVPNICCKLIGY